MSVSSYRKVIQISFAAYQGCGLVALCDDGTLWFNDRPHDPSNPKWSYIQPPPQPEPIECNITAEQLKEAQQNEKAE